MKIGVVGPGAVGCLFAAFLKEAGEEVWLIDHNPERAARIAGTGIRVEGISGERVVEIGVCASPEEIGICELILVCVKSYDTEAAVRSNLSLVGDTSFVLTLQNGLGNMEIISSLDGEEKTLGGITAQGATLLGDGHIRHAGKGETVIGKVNPKSPLRQAQDLAEIQNSKMEEIAELLEKAGFNTKIVANARDIIWSKLIINVGINALTAITGLKNGKLVEIRYTEMILEEAVKEALAVASARGVKISCEDPLEKVKSVCRATAGNISSMLQDVRKKRRTEIDFINGAIVKEAERLKIDVPVNRVLTNLVKTIESG